MPIDISKIMITATSRTKKTATATTAIRAGGQVQIPLAIAKKYRLEEGDVLTLRDLGKGFIVIIPRKAKQDEEINVNPLTQDILWDKMEEEASEAIRNGDVSPQFETADDLIAYLHLQKI